MSPAASVLVDAVGLALLHSVWQVSLLAAVLWGLLRSLEGGSPRVRYGISVLAMLLAPVAFVATVVSAWDPVAVEGATLSAVAEVVQRARPIAVPAAAPAAPAWQPVLVGVWGAGVGVFSLLFLSGLLQTRRLKTVGLLPVPADLQARAGKLASSMGLGRAVPVRVSRLAEVPMVVGALRPVILLPGAALTGLSPAQLEAILLHELAHVRRGDLWVGLLQGLVEIGLFFHPGVWWMSQRIRAERELCCDDEVAARVDPLGYARALLLLEEGRASNRALAAAATDGSLKHRISRLAGVQEPPRRASRSFSAVVLLGMLALLPTGVAVAGDDDGLQAMVEEFAAMTISIDDPDDPRRKQDRSLRDDLTAMVDAFTELEAHIVSLVEDDPDRWGVEGPLRLGQAREAMGMRIRSSDIPSYLDDDQAAIYQGALEARGNAQLSVAEKAYELALARALERDQDDLVAEIREGLASVQSLQATEGPLTFVPTPSPMVTVEKALVRYGEGDVAGALALFESVEAEAEVDAETLRFVLYRKAWCQSDLGQHDEAIAALAALALSEDPAFVETILPDLAAFYIRAERLEQGAVFFGELGQGAVWEAALAER